MRELRFLKGAQQDLVQIPDHLDIINKDSNGTRCGALQFQSHRFSSTQEGPLSGHPKEWCTAGIGITLCHKHAVPHCVADYSFLRDCDLHCLVKGASIWLACEMQGEIVSCLFACRVQITALDSSCSTFRIQMHTIGGVCYSRIKCLR